MNQNQQFKILTSPSFIFIENTFIKEFIAIERHFYSIYPLKSCEEILNSDITSIITSDGILGVIDIASSKYLLVIRQSRPICQFLKIDVQSIREIDLILISPTEANQNSKEILQKHLIQLLLNGFYYSNGKDLTRTMQDKQSNASNTNSKAKKAFHHSIYNCNKDYMWNYNLIQPFLNFKIDERFLACCIYGYMTKITKPIQSIPLEFIIISRRLIYNYSLYGRDNGLMELPNHRICCHNFIETECITQFGPNVFSLVMYSSSLPVYSDKDKSQQETNKHFSFYINNINAKYNKIAMMAFYHSDNNSGNEAMVKIALEQAIYSFKSNFLKYSQFNTLNKYDYDSIVIEYNQICDCFEFFGILPNRIIEQKGIFYIMSNKIMNTESSNELMMALAWHYLNKQISSFINGDQSTKLNKINTVDLLDLDIDNNGGNNNANLHEREELRAAFKEMWLKNRKALDYEKNLPGVNKPCQIINQKVIDYLIDDNTIKRKYLLNKKLNLFIGTWNSAGIDPLSSYDLSPWFNSHNQNSLNSKYSPDILFLGMQEVVELNVGNIVLNLNEENVNKWNALIYKGIEKAFPNIEYIPIKKMDLVGILFVCYVKKGIEFIEMDSLIIKTGALGALGNKGSCLFSINYLGTSIAFATGHFCAGQKKVNERTNELSALLNTPLVNALNDKVQFKHFTDWFIFGDINYRVDLEYNDAISHLNQNDIHYLLQYDQLNSIIDKAFDTINETHIEFMPTYQYIIGTDEFQPKKLRIPSWCDRILYKKKSDVKNIEYNIVNKIKYSDHRPVYAIFELNCTQILTNEKEILLQEIKEYNEQRNPEFKLENAYTSKSTRPNHIKQVNEKAHPILKPNEPSPINNLLNQITY